MEVRTTQTAVPQRKHPRINLRWHGSVYGKNKKEVELWLKLASATYKESLDVQLIPFRSEGRGKTSKLLFDVSRKMGESGKKSQARNAGEEGGSTKVEGRRK